MNLNVYAPMLLCLVPLVATFLLLAILVPDISILREFLAVLAGLVAFVPIVILQFLFLGSLQKFMHANLFLSIIYSLIFFGMIEEGVKTASLLILKSRGESLRNFFAYSILAGMTLGCFESVVYLLTALGTRPQVSADFLRMIFLRMPTSLAIHTLCAGLGGLCIFYSKNIRRNFSPLIFAILIHGIYDFFAAFDSPLKFFSVALILLAVLECRIFYLRVRENLVSKKSSSSKNFDSEKTIEIPKNPALVISVKGGTEKSQTQMQDVQKEKKKFFEKNAEEGAEDFEEIQKEAEVAIKAEESKKIVSRKSANSENDSEKTVVKKSSKRISASKTNSAKGTARNSLKPASEEKSTRTKISSNKISAEKTVVRKSSAKNSADSKKSTSAKKNIATSTTKKSAPKSSAKKFTDGKK